MEENLRFIRPLLRGLPIIIISVLLSVIGAKKYLNYVTPMYESTAMLKLADVNEGVPGANLFKDLDVFATANKISTEIEVIKSSSLIEKTLAELPFALEIYRKGDVLSVELYNNSPILIQHSFFNEKSLDTKYLLNVESLHNFSITHPKTLKKIKGFFGKPILLEGGYITICLNKPYLLTKQNAKIIDLYEFEFLSRTAILTKVNKNLDVVPVDKDVPVIRINYKSNVPEKAAEFVNKLAENYINDYIENKYAAAQTTVNFLNKEITVANNKLSESEDNIQNFRDEKRITNIPQETETDLRKISQLKIQLSNLKMNLDAIQKLNEYIKNGNNFLDLAVNFEAFTDLLSTEMVKNIKKLQADKKDLLLIYTPDNEKVKVIDRKINDLVNYQIESIKNTEKNLQIKYDDLKNDIETAEKVFIGLPGKEKKLNILTRSFNLLENNYNFLNEKRIEAEIAKAAKISFHKIISYGDVSKTPVSPIKSIIIIVAALMGLFGSIIIIFLVHLSKAKVNDTYTIEKNSNIPIAYSTPFLKDYLKIRNYFLQETLQLEIKKILNVKEIICFSSFDRSKDHLFQSKNIYQALTEQNRKVLFIDVTGEMLGLINQNNYINFSDPSFLRYTLTMFQEIIVNKMKLFDYCIIHNNQIKNEGLALIFMSIATQNLIVLDSRKTAAKNILKIELLRNEFNLQNTWFILNKINYNPSVWKEIKIIYHIILKKYFK